MSASASPGSTQEVPTRPAELAKADASGFEERWAAWLARGAAHDRTIRRRMMFAGPTLAIAAAILYVLLVR